MGELVQVVITQAQGKLSINASSVPSSSLLSSPSLWIIVIISLIMSVFYCRDERGGRVESFIELKSQLNLERLIEISRDRNRSKQVLQDAHKPFRCAVVESLYKSLGDSTCPSPPPPMTKLLL